jgi:hypothetical protein
MAAAAILLVQGICAWSLSVYITLSIQPILFFNYYYHYWTPRLSGIATTRSGKNRNKRSMLYSIDLNNVLFA